MLEVYAMAWGLSAWARCELPEFVVTVTDQAIARLRHLVPSSGKITERLRDNKPRFIGELMEHGIVWILSP
jgi:hypothetical protein